MYIYIKTVLHLKESRIIDYVENATLKISS